MIQKVLWAALAAALLAPSVYAQPYPSKPVMSKLPYDPIKDFAPVSYVGYVPNVLSLHPSVPAKSMKELVSRC